MYEVIDIMDYDMTRDVKVLNDETGTEDVCFDDSRIAGADNFGFIKKGMHYDMKILLFGGYNEEETPETVRCLIKNDVVIGIRKLLEVMVGKYTYYVLRSNLPTDFEGSSFLFYCTRRDLIQVEDIVHADLFAD